MACHGLRASLLMLLASTPLAASDPLTFERDIRPIFRAHCFDCHGATEELSGGLDLRLVRSMTKGGDSGSAIAPGDTASSYLLDRIRNGEMPPGTVKVPREEIAIVERWIAEGANTARPEPDSLPPGLGIAPEERDFWAFHPVKRPAVPQTVDSGHVRTPVDAFLLRKLEESGLSFSPDADRPTIIRRAYFDLIGLPPTADEVERFVADDRPDAYERLIDDLLADPRYGERWSRHWLDVAGYADSEGSMSDPPRPDAYKYRDYVIRSFNGDKPIDQFIVEQLAGDELVPDTGGDPTPERIEALTATGFLRMAPDGTAAGGRDPAVRNQVVADTLQIVSSSLLGLTVACAQCHDHRYDPIPQTDYYRLRAVFEPAFDVEAWKRPSERRVSLATAADRARAAELEAEAQKLAAERSEKQKEFIKAALEKELLKHPEELRESLRAAYETPAKDRTDEQKKLLADRPSVNITPGVLYQYDPAAAEELKKFDAQIAAIRAKKPVEEFVRALTEPPNHTPPTHLFHRGDHRQPKQVVQPGDLLVLAPEEKPFEIATDDPERPTTGRRLAYAQHLTSGEHPLFARVFVNRIWLNHFGRGIVETPGDFGRLGSRPTHPELLDWLADEFEQSGWSLKQLHRTIMLSTAYRQGTRRDSMRDELDADGRLYSRFPVRRLDAEALRDRMLATSGTLVSKLYGPPVAIKPDDAGRVVVEGADVRRSVYLTARRSEPLTVLTAFDAPVMAINCEQRSASTVATQALLLMNGEFTLRHARLLAERVRREATRQTLPLPPPFGQDFVERPPTWQFGYTRLQSSADETVRFEPLPHWTGSAWQGGPALPNAKLSWALLHATGGHPGEQLAVVRRWTAPREGIAKVTGTLSHSAENGDGVVARAVSSNGGRLGEWKVARGEVETHVAEILVQPDDVIDFVVEGGESINADSFGWTLTIEMHDATGAHVGKWDSKAGFHGPAGPPATQQVVHAWRLAYGRNPSADEMGTALEFLSDQAVLLASNEDAELAALTNLCQALLGSNEVLYVD